MLRRLAALRQRQSVIASFAALDAVPEETSVDEPSMPEVVQLEETLKQDIAALASRWRAGRGTVLGKARGRAGNPPKTSAAA